MNLEERTRKIREYFVLTVSMLINCFFLYESIQIFLKKPAGDSPGTFPLLLSIAMIILNICVFFESCSKMPKQVEKFPSVLSAIKAAAAEELPINVVASVLATAAYIILMVVIGFLPSTFLFLVGLSVYLDRKNWKVVMLSSAVITILVYVVFGLIFRVRL